MAGAGGHISHPYELSWIKTGTELIHLFERIKQSIKERNSASLKIDGVNLSFRVIKEDGKHHFAIDRGTSNELDITGVTLERLSQRFPPEHGMIGYSTKALTMLNEALPNILGELKLLGMLDDNSRFFNSEFVSNTTNVVEHKDTFLAIHGVNQFYARGNRKGPFNPSGNNDVSREIKYDKRVFERLIKKLTPFAEKHGLSIHNQIIAESKREIDFSEALLAPCTVQISSTAKVTKTIKEWLTEAYNPHNERVKLYADKPVYATSRKLYNLIKQGNPITEMVHQEDSKKAIYGFIMVEATRVLGQQVLNSMSCRLGEVKDFEGIVVRDGQVNPHGPIKLTGNFIINGQNSPFSKNNKPELKEEQVIGEGSSIAIVPGAFKPPHRGHLAMVENLSKSNDKVLVIISSPLKSNRSIPGMQDITAEHSKKIWEMIGSDFKNVEYAISPKASPVNAAYDFIESNRDKFSKITIGISNKGSDVSKFSRAFSNVQGVDFSPLAESAIQAEKHSQEYMSLLENCQFKNEMPSIAGNYDPSVLHSSDMRYLISKRSDPTASSMLSDFISENVKDKVLSIFEMSSAGASGGYAGPVVKKKVPRQQTKRLYRSSLPEESIINEVYELITSKGIVK